MQLTLHHVRDLVKRRGRLSSRDGAFEAADKAGDIHTEAPLTGTSRRSSSREIPTGILLHILSFVSRQDLLAISRASKRLNAVADIALYSSIKIGANSSKWFRENRIPLDEHSQAALYRTIRAPRFTTLVTEFRVDFSWCSSRNVTFSNKVPKNQCTCDELDQLLGQALVSLKNLRLLHFFCICCEDPSDKRHLYLQDLRAECLENLAFECQCMPVTSSKPFRILSAPCMRSVTSLKWEALGNVEPDASMRSILEDKECLPKLKTLIFRENLEAVAPLISKSQLEYIQCSTLDERLQGLLDQQPGALKYLRVLEERPTLPNWLSYSPQTYRNLLIVGEIYSTLRGVSKS